MKSSVPLPHYLPILSSVWFKRGKDDLASARVSTRRGGVYQIEVAGEPEPRLVKRDQIVRRDS